MSVNEDLWIDLIGDSLEGIRGRDNAVTASKTWQTPGELAEDLDPVNNNQTPALELIDQVLVRVDRGELDRVIITMPPQEGKSTRVTKVGALWSLIRNPNRRIVVISYAKDLAQEFGRDIRGYITSNGGTDGELDLGLRIARDNGSVTSWRLEGKRGGVRSVGVGGGITGRPADYMIIDDPISNREQAESETYRNRAKNFWTSTASTRLAPGAPVIVVLTRWHEDDLAGFLLGRADGHRWHVVNIPAQAMHKPEQGETDVLGRQPGEFMQSARVHEETRIPRSDTEWEQIKVQAGSRDWEALYQGNPSPPEGGMFKRDNWRYYDNPLWLVSPDGRHYASGFDTMLTSWDMAFKDKKDSDYVVGQVWARRGVEAFLLDQVRGRWDFPESKRQVLGLWAKWPQCMLHVVEDKANGTAVIASLRSVVPGIVADEPHGSKVARASAVSPLQEAQQIWLPSPELLGPDGLPYAPWVTDFVEEAAGFPNATNDDQVDGMSQGINRLIIQPFLDGSLVTAEDLAPELADYQISNY